MRHYTIEKYSLQECGGVIVDKETILDNQINLKVHKIRKQAICPVCKTVSRYHYDTRAKPSTIRHLNYHSKPVYLLIKKRRFKCLDCNKVFTEQIPKLVKPYQRKTNQFNYAVLKHLKTHNFKDTQKSFKVSFSYLINQLYGLVDSNSHLIDWTTEFAGNDSIALGIDEHGFKKRHLVLTVSNLTQKKLITILPAYTKQELGKFLRSIPAHFRKRIAYVATDLTNKYGQIIKEWLPNVAVSADHFHIIRLANQLLWQEKRVIEGVYRKHQIKYFKLLLKARERLTKEQSQKVKVVLKTTRHRRLKIAYALKEKIRHILSKERVNDKEQAKQEFINLAHSDVWNKGSSLNRRELLQYSKYYRTFIETLQRWETEIITFIQTRITNGYTEGIHTKIKLLKRQSYGIRNINTYIKRMILALSDDYFT